MSSKEEIARRDCDCLVVYYFFAVGLVDRISVFVIFITSLDFV